MTRLCYDLAMLSRRLFAVGAWVLVALGLVHLLGHYNMVNAEGADETQRQLLALMRDYRQDLGAGFVRSTMDLMAGFSLTFSILSLGIGLLNLLLLRHEAGFSPLLRSAAAVDAGVFGIMSAMAWRYWFSVPFSFLALAFLCFGASLALSRRRDRT